MHPPRKRDHDSRIDSLILSRHRSHLYRVRAFTKEGSKNVNWISFRVASPGIYYRTTSPSRMERLWLFLLHVFRQAIAFRNRRQKEIIKRYTQFHRAKVFRFLAKAHTRPQWNCIVRCLGHFTDYFNTFHFISVVSRALFAHCETRNVYSEKFEHSVELRRVYPRVYHDVVLRSFAYSNKARQKSWHWARLLCKQSEEGRKRKIRHIQAAKA